MNATFLLNKDDQLAYTILTQMAQRSSLAVTKEYLLKTFNLTNYQIDKYFAMINTDLALVSTADKPAFLDQDMNGTWFAHHFETYVRQKLFLVYLERSSLFLAFEYQFLFSNQMTKRAFVKQSPISTTAFYSNLNSLDKLLEAEHFNDAAALDIEPEFTLRLRLFELYYTAYAGVDTPFADLDEVINLLLDMLAPLFPDSLPPSQTAKLAIFLKIWLLRLRNQEQLTQDTRLISAIPEADQPVFTDIAHLLSAEFELTVTEQRYLYTFLLTQGFLPLPPTQMVDQEFPQMYNLTENFLGELATMSDLIAISPTTLRALHVSLDAIHLQFTTFFVEPTTFIDAEQISFFRELYPAFDQVINRFIETLKQTMTISTPTTINLYFSYMFAMIAAIPASELNDVVVICVDFSQGILYSDYVIQTLGAFHHAHIVIERQVSADTDIYISDFRAQNVLLPQVIWQNPPTPSDWSDLADMILELKTAKTAALLKSEKEADHDAN